MKKIIIFFGFIFSNIAFTNSNFPLEVGETFMVKNLSKNYASFKKLSDSFCRKKVWVRNFHQEDNGGGHQWMSLKAQRIEKAGFNCYNWRQCQMGRTCNNPQFSCSESERPEDSTCLAQSLTPEQSLNLLSWMANLELTGVPDVASFDTSSSDFICPVDPQDQSKPGTRPRDLNNKTVFSSDTYSCCLGAGETVSEDALADDCCSGFIVNSKCALPDYANVSVYLNVYVSTEAHHLNPSYVDEKTGYIKNRYQLERLACEKHVCASNKIALGVAISNLKVPGHEDDSYNVKRFVVEDGGVSKANSEVAKLYDAGLRWNNQVYCAPDALVSQQTIGLSVVDCGVYQGNFL